MEPFGLRFAVHGGGSQMRVDVSGSAGLAAWPVHDGTGACIATIHGALLTGWLGAGLRLSDGVVHCDRSFTTAADFERCVVDGVHGLVVVLTAPGGPFGNRLYGDGGGSIPLVYCPEKRNVAGSADQILDGAEYDERFLVMRHRRLIVAEGHGWISGDLTAHQGVFRLLPNHYLDLGDFTAHRFWPRRHEFEQVMPVGDAAAAVAHSLRGFVEACVTQYDTALTLTAGWDSRLIAAAARDLRDLTGFITIAAPGSQIDQDIAAELAACFGLRHRFYPLVTAGAAEQARWDRMVGHCVREANRVTHPTLGLVPQQLILTGIYGEPGRARLYRQDTAIINDTPATAAFIMARLTIPEEPETLAAIHSWLAPLHWLPRSAILDLAYVELKGGSWAMAQGTVQKAVKWAMMPFAQRSVQNAFMSVPPAEKGTEALFRAIGERLWPEIAAMPVNRYGDYRDVTAKVSKVFDRERVIRFLRDRLA